MCGWTKTIRMRYMWTRNFLRTEKKPSILRICGQGLNATLLIVPERHMKPLFLIKLSDSLAVHETPKLYMHKVQNYRTNLRYPGRA